MQNGGVIGLMRERDKYGSWWGLRRRERIYCVREKEIKEREN